MHCVCNVKGVHTTEEGWGELGSLRTYDSNLKRYLLALIQQR